MACTDRDPCQSCRKVYENFKTEPPCEKCFPGCHEQNFTALQIWNRVSGQWVASPSGISSINLCAIDIVIECMEIDKKDKLHFIDQVLTIGDTVIGAIYRKQEADSALKKR